MRLVFVSPNGEKFGTTAYFKQAIQAGYYGVDESTGEAFKMVDVKARLEYLRGEIEAERISYGELSELQDLAPYIDPSDVLLLEWAGVPEFPE